MVFIWLATLPMVRKLTVMIPSSVQASLLIGVIADICYLANFHNVSRFRGARESRDDSAEDFDVIVVSCLHVYCHRNEVTSKVLNDLHTCKAALATVFSALITGISSGFIIKCMECETKCLIVVRVDSSG